MASDATTPVSYTALARRFRPQTFAEVVGQQHVAQALNNAIRNARVAHAYLFTGARGVGKTSMARILAKSLNCECVQDGTPCNACEICEGISAGRDVDVLEIDGASNNGVDDIRLLRANVNVRSMRTQYKMYIIDEVHMLTKAAFNALLKTLEEPPPKVIFVFCTTEPNKVLDTILSRCQRFDFAAIQTANIVVRLAQIAEAEDFEVEQSALELVARRAEGSMRDSQSLFDQLLAFGETRITADEVHRLLGTANDERLLELLDGIVAGRSDAVLESTDSALAAGVRMGELLDQLIACLRDLMVVSSGTTAVELLALPESARGQLLEQSQNWGLRTVLAGLEILSETKARFRLFRSVRPVLELALVRLCQLRDLEPIGEVIQRLHAADVTRASAAPSEPAVPLSSGTAAAPAAPSKKTENSSEMPRDAEHQVEPGAKTVPLRPGCEQDILSQLISMNKDLLKQHLQGVAQIAISGPNSLVLRFSSDYTFSKQYCERTEVRSRLQQNVQSITGADVRIELQLQVPEMEDAGGQSTGAAPAAASAAEPPADEQDPFVQQAADLFGAKIAKVEDLSRPSTFED
jgi:DNA polymerase-3 subunit gamma/tau